MAILIKRLQHHRAVIFDTGKFDDWCVYVVERNGYKKAPHDETYFSDLCNIKSKYAGHKVYDDFVRIYERTTGKIDPAVLSLIDELVTSYLQEDRILVEQWFTVIYAGMIAEENKVNAVLKKRIKRLGMHQVLILDIPAVEAARFSKGKKWNELDAIMKPLGF